MFRTCVFLALVLVSSFAMANPAGGVTSFECVTLGDSYQPRRILFALDMTDSKNILIVNLDKKPFKVIPWYQPMGALYHGDNFNVTDAEDRIQVDADEIGFLHTTLVLWKRNGLAAGYVKTSGETNKETYSPMQCNVQ